MAESSFYLNEYLLHLSRYIHQNPPNILKKGQKLEDYPYSSFRQYLNLSHQDWVKAEGILAILKEEFGNGTSYRKFTEDNEIESPLLADENYTLEENA